MPKNQFFPTFFLILTYFLHTHVEICKGVSVLELKSMELDPIVKRVCSKKVGDIEMEDEMMMDSESNRRVLLMGKRYISYDTLKRDLVPCDRPGASYYNCNGPPVANTYRRGCEIITRCDRGN